MLKMFISYRRSDSHHITDRIFDRLALQFGQENVFKDVTSIPIGTDFRRAIEDAVGACDVLLVVIGRTWLATKNDDGTRRLADTNDLVRIEIEWALRREIPVVPVLVDEAQMPPASELPEPLRALAFRHAAHVHADPYFRADIERLIAGLRGHIKPPRATEPPPGPSLVVKPDLQAGGTASWGQLLGIDFGTSSSVIATLDANGQPATVPNAEGGVLTPSAVFFSDDGKVVVGQPALDIALEQPERVVTLAKRRIGYPDLGREVNGRRFRPETAAAVVIRKLAQDATTRIGPLGGVVVTVPAYYDDTRRTATRDAARIAGLDVLDILDEPVAAVLAYAHRYQVTGNRTVLVYDLGGGTFDVTIVRLSKKRFQVLAIEGDVRLGGQDWDDRLVSWAADQFRNQFGLDPRDDPQALVALRAAAERAKWTLSKVESAVLSVACAGHKVPLKVTRSEFERLTQHLLVRTRLTTQQLLRAAGVTWPQVDEVLLVGGSTQMPSVRAMLKDLSGREANAKFAVREAVALGAALHAGKVALSLRQAPADLSPAGRESLESMVSVTALSHSLGVEVRDGMKRANCILVKKNSQLPAEVNRTFQTVRDDQRRVRVRILQGEAPQAEACIPLGECWIEGLPLGLPKGSGVEVQCRVGANGIVQVSAREVNSGRQVDATLNSLGGLSAEELASEEEWLRACHLD